MNTGQLATAIWNRVILNEYKAIRLEKPVTTMLYFMHGEKPMLLSVIGLAKKVVRHELH